MYSPSAVYRKRLPVVAADVDSAWSTPGSGVPSLCLTFNLATAVVIGTPLQVSRNLTGTVLPSLKRLELSGLMGCSKPPNADPYDTAYPRVALLELPAPSLAWA